jgi:hypothetical protein
VLVLQAARVIAALAPPPCSPGAAVKPELTTKALDSSLGNNCAPRTNAARFRPTPRFCYCCAINAFWCNGHRGAPTNETAFALREMSCRCAADALTSLRPIWHDGCSYKSGGNHRRPHSKESYGHHYSK